MNKELNKLLKDSVLTELVSKGVKVFDYQKGTMCYLVGDEKIKMGNQPTEVEIFDLVKRILYLYGKEFNETKPHVCIEDDEVKIVATTRPYTEYLSFYLDIGNGI